MWMAVQRVLFAAVNRSRCASEWLSNAIGPMPYGVYLYGRSRYIDSLCADLVCVSRLLKSNFHRKNERNITDSDESIRANASIAS